MVENAPKHLPYQSSPEYKWKKKKKKLGGICILQRKKRVATQRRADPENYKNTGGSMTTLVAAGHLELHR